MKVKSVDVSETGLVNQEGTAHLQATKAVEAIEYFLTRCKRDGRLAYFMVLTESLDRMVDAVTAFRGKPPLNGIATESYGLAVVDPAGDLRKRIRELEDQVTDLQGQLEDGDDGDEDDVDYMSTDANEESLLKRICGQVNTFGRNPVEVLQDEMRDYGLMLEIRG